MFSLSVAAMVLGGVTIGVAKRPHRRASGTQVQAVVGPGSLLVRGRF